MSIAETGVIPAHLPVAIEVRSWLARRGLSANKAATQLGWGQQYLSRRIRGEVAFDVTDLIILGDLLEVDPGQFFHSPEDGRSGLGVKMRWLLRKAGIPA